MVQAKVKDQSDKDKEKDQSNKKKEKDEDQLQKDNRSVQLNPTSDTFHKDRGLDGRPDDWQDGDD